MAKNLFNRADWEAWHTLFWTQMNADYQDFKHKELTEKIIKIFCRVYNKLGYGFLEKIYENAMMIELSKSN